MEGTADLQVSAESFTATRAGVVPRPALFERLRTAGRVVQVSAPAGSGKTYLVRSWTEDEGLSDQVGWVSVGRGNSDAATFWVDVVAALRTTAPGSGIVQALTAAPDLDCWAALDGLLEDLLALTESLWLVIDDVQELHGGEAMRLLELLLMRSPSLLRFVILTRRDVPLGLHRLRLEGQVTEIRAGDLRFSLGEARHLFEAAGLQVSDQALARLVARTEGWAAGLRLAALSMSGHPDPDRFAAEFSGSDRIVAEYLLAEILDRQPDPIRRLLLRTSVLESVNGALADAMTGDTGGERILQDLEDVNAFVVSTDPGRSWFRYHQLFSDLLQLQLRRTEPDQVTGLHTRAAEWYAAHDHPVEAVRHAEAAEDWVMAGRLLTDCWFRLGLSGRGATLHRLLNRIPAEVIFTDAELTALLAGKELTRGSLDEARRYLSLSTAGAESVPAERRARFQVGLGILRLMLSRQCGDLPAVIEEAEGLLGPIDSSGGGEPGLSQELCALVLVTLGGAELWTGRYADSERHLDEGIAMARRAEQPYLEMMALGQLAACASMQSSAARAEQHSTAAIELAERHGWLEEPVVAAAYVIQGSLYLWNGRLDEGEMWLSRAERTLRADLEPAVGVLFHLSACALGVARGKYEAALARARAAAALAGRLSTPHALARRPRAREIQILIRMGQHDLADRLLNRFAEVAGDSPEFRMSLAMLHLARGEPRKTLDLLAPTLEDPEPAAGSEAPGMRVAPAIESALLEAAAREELGDRDGAASSLERALGIGAASHVILPFSTFPDPALIERHSGDRTAHRAFLLEVRDLLFVQRGGSAALGQGRILGEPLSKSEARLLRYLPTNLTGPEIARELYLSANTVKTHLRRVYEKLGVHSRREAVERARALGLLSPSVLAK